MKFHPEIAKIITIVKENDVEDKVQCPFCLELLERNPPNNYLQYSCVKCNFFLMPLFSDKASEIGVLTFQLKIDKDNYTICQIYTNKIFTIDKFNILGSPPSLMDSYSKNVVRIDDIIIDINFKDISVLKEQIETYIMMS